MRHLIQRIQIVVASSYQNSVKNSALSESDEVPVIHKKTSMISFQGMAGFGCLK
jgi:hypothetical protein